ncbi:MAG TPA: Asp-tRNA(Asn)/Glu-tRNA(Gln) amidotransferase subunit GatC [Gemmatimonadaceae bacterium]|jgi:aspartyl-tRNA(Asn)/glutamyl-tRNA(Gln) amidotransferase subunit C|nr:Asp-tRNA(Asn)/Glu-tRNA(Gln) amidotransferase subunit GatC [Gemmatimonadaceae bacterium]
MAETLTPADVRRIATLARLELTADEIETFAEQLTAILAYADQVQQVDTSDAAFTSPASIVEPLRATRGDDPAPCLPRELVLDQAPDADRGAGVFKVPRVLGS